MPDLMSTLPPLIFAYACAVTLLAGFVKGAVGFAMPLIMVSGLGVMIAPELAIAAIILPIVVSNALQVAKSGLGNARASILEHWRYILIVCVMILIAAQFVVYLPGNTMFTVLGVPVVGLCIIQLVGWRPQIPAAWRRTFEWSCGALSGVLGGMAGTWGPTTVLYLLALDTPRDKQMSIQGVIYGLGSIMLLLGHLRSGILNADTWGLSLAMLPFALAGMWLGFRLGDGFDQERFRKVTLIVLILAGANLIRRGLMG